MKSKFRAYTLVEVLIVIAILGVLVALLVPAINIARNSGGKYRIIDNNSKQEWISKGRPYTNYRGTEFRDVNGDEIIIHGSVSIKKLGKSYDN